MLEPSIVKDDVEIIAGHIFYQLNENERDDQITFDQIRDNDDITGRRLFGAPERRKGLEYNPAYVKYSWEYTAFMKSDKDFDIYNTPVR